MARKIEYADLYQFQDDILKIIFALENAFYLTGGTALHRFYFGARYSDDLDFFAGSDQNFHEDVNEIFDALSEKGFLPEKTVSSQDFYRVMVNEVLRLDFVNDRVYRHGKSNIIDGIRVDNKINIFANKITALMNRDEEKDFFDVFCIAYHENFNWKDMLEIANKKHRVEKDLLIYRIKTFPLQWLGRIKAITPIDISRENIDLMCDDILNESDNRLNSRNGQWRTDR